MLSPWGVITQWGAPHTVGDMVNIAGTHIHRHTSTYSYNTNTQTHTHSYNTNMYTCRDTDRYPHAHIHRHKKTQIMTQKLINTHRHTPYTHMVNIDKIFFLKKSLNDKMVPKISPFQTL